MDNKLARIRLFLFCSILFFFTTSIYLLYLSIFEINEEQKVLEDRSSTSLDIGEFRFEKDVLYLFGITIAFVFLFGLLAVYLKSVCMLLFYSTTGNLFFLLLLNSFKSSNFFFNKIYQDAECSFYFY